MKRAAVFVIYHKDGLIDRSVDYYLSQLKAYTSRIVIVVNGKLAEQGKKALSPYSEEIIVRENTGYDVAAYQTGIRAIGYEVLKEYDELWVINDSVFGPVYPLEQMLTAMEKRPNLSLWGVTGHRCMKEMRLPDNPCGYMEAHIQSYFTAYRKSLLLDRCFEEYWENLPLVQNRQQAIDRHETYATYYFAQHGFSWDCYVPMAENSNTEDMLHMEALRALQEFRCPFLKKNLFSVKSPAPAMLQNIRIFVTEQTGYDFSIVTDTAMQKLSTEEKIAAIQALAVQPTPEMRAAKKLYDWRMGVKRVLKKSRLVRAIWQKIKN